LLQDFGRLARILDLGQRDFLLAGDEVGRAVGGRNVGRVHRGDVHRQAAGQLFIAALDLDQHADAAAVHVGTDVVGGVDPRHAPDLHVLADLGDQVGAGLVDALAGAEPGRLQCLDVGGAAVQRDLGHFVGEGQEVGVLGDEVGLGVDLDQHRLAGGLGHRDAALGGDAAGLLVGLGEAGLAQPVGGGLDVAVVLGECLLALHHAGAGPLAQLLDHRSSDVCHGGITSNSCGCRADPWSARNGPSADHASALRSPGYSADGAWSAAGASAAGASAAGASSALAAAFFAGALRARRAGFSPSPLSANSSPRTLAACGAAALPSSTAWAAARAYS